MSAIEELVVIYSEEEADQNMEVNGDQQNDANANIENITNMMPNQDNCEDFGDQYKKKTRRKVSKVWDEFTILEIGGNKKVKCKHCKTLFKFSESGTTTQYKRHLDSCPKRKLTITGQPQLSMHVSTTRLDPSGTLRPWKYDH
ncbi:Zinc finger BED domain-containing protein RICESLEEPER 1, partial [Bienertia sinuspersici]